MVKIKLFTDLQQSKKLAEFLPLESADMEYLTIKENGILVSSVPFVKDDSEVEDSAYSHTYDRIHCWSLAALMNLLPSEFTEKGKYSETTYKIDIRKYALTDDVDLYQIAYGNYHWYEDGSYVWSDMINTGEKKDLLDAVFQMVIWLKENKKL